jgi:hypothetical protein
MIASAASRRLSLLVFVALVASLPGVARADHQVDHDGDGFASFEDGGGDCDDNDALRFPGAAEICDADERDEDCDMSTLGSRDADGDGFIDALCCNDDGQSRACGNDCVDNNRGVHPIAPEVCNGIDDNCNGGIDDGLEVDLFPDTDADGFGTGISAPVCPGTPFFAASNIDCDDSDPTITPGVMLCQPDGSIRICGADGAFSVASCGLGLACTTQPNGHGVCEGVGGGSAGIADVPAVSTLGLTALALGLAGFAATMLRRHVF